MRGAAESAQVDPLLGERSRDHGWILGGDSGHDGRVVQVGLAESQSRHDAHGRLQLVGGHRDRQAAGGGRSDDVVERALRDEVPGLQDHHVVAGRLDLGEPVGAQQRRRAASGQRAHEVADLHRALGIEPVGRLVEHHDRRVADQRQRDPDALAHPQRERAGAVVRAIGQAHAVQDLAHLGVAHRESHRRDADLEILHRADVLVERRRLDDRPDLARRLAKAGRALLVAEDARVPARGALQAQ